MPILLALLFLFMPLKAATAADESPVGDWLVAKRLAVIRVVNCKGGKWGVVAWEKHHALDKNNPDPKKRSRPTLGMPILLDMKPSGPDKWSGEIYNSNNGHTYSGSISLKHPDVLRVEGCVLGILCGGEDWSRVKAGAAGGSAGAGSNEAPKDICDRVLASTKR